LQEDLSPPRVQENIFLQPLFNITSDRLQAIEPFSPPLEKTFSDLRPLLKVNGKCSVDQISPAGKWLKFRGHLESISNNLFSLVPNGFREELGKGKNLLAGGIESFSKIAKDYKKEEIGWIAIGHDNYGEGISNEYAALSMRYLGGKSVIAKSIAPLYEINLKKQGILVLTFARGDDGDKIREDDLIDLLKADQFTIESSFELLLKHADGTTERLPLTHSYNEQQLSWFKAGSALNASGAEKK
jgi:aconitate hydratase